MHPRMWILVIVLALSTDKTCFTYIEREARVPFYSAQQCEAELHRWFLTDGENLGDVTTLPEAEGSDDWVPTYAECQRVEQAQV